MDLVEWVYSLTAQFPRRENFALTAQLRRAVVSIPSNIAEGHARSTRRDYASFLATAQGSLSEAETLLTLSVRLGYATEPAVQPVFAMMDEVGRMLGSLRRRLAAEPTRQTNRR